MEKLQFLCWCGITMVKLPSGLWDMMLQAFHTNKSTHAQTGEEISNFQFSITWETHYWHFTSQRGQGSSWKGNPILVLITELKERKKTELIKALRKRESENVATLDILFPLHLCGKVTELIKCEERRLKLRLMRFLNQLNNLMLYVYLLHPIFGKSHYHSHYLAYHWLILLISNSYLTISIIHSLLPFPPSNIYTYHSVYK